MRSAAFFGACGIIISSKRSSDLSPVVSKASSGAMEWLPIYRTHGSLADFLETLNARQNSSLVEERTVRGVAAVECNEEDKGDSCEQWRIIGLTSHVDGAVSHFNLEPGPPSFLVLGNEGRGMTEEVLTRCNVRATIMGGLPSEGSALGSLNVSNAAAIVMCALMPRQTPLSPNAK